MATLKAMEWCNKIRFKKNGEKQAKDKVKWSFTGNIYNGDFGVYANDNSYDELTKKIF